MSRQNGKLKNVASRQYLYITMEGERARLGRSERVCCHPEAGLYRWAKASLRANNPIPRSHKDFPTFFVRSRPRSLSLISKGRLVNEKCRLHTRHYLQTKHR